VDHRTAVWYRCDGFRNMWYKAQNGSLKGQGVQRGPTVQYQEM